MRRSLAVTVLLCAVLPACASFRKECYGNGVCRVEKEGVVSWEGPPDKVAELKGREDAKNKAVAANDQAWAAAPRRSGAEPIRLVLVGPTTEYPDLQPFVGAYRQMMEQALQGDPRIQLVPYKDVKFLVEASSGDRPGQGFGRAEIRTAVDEALTRRLRDGGADVDVVLVAHLATKKVSGLVSGGGGVGVAELNNVEFGGSLSSIYSFQEHKGSQVGKSTDSISLAGIDKSGKKGSGEVKGKRNPENDRPAVQGYGAWARSTIQAQIAAELPSLAAVKEIRAKNGGDAKVQMGDALRKLLGK
jgi:hypothetical protein